MGYETLDDHAVAGLLAREAGDLLLDLRGRALAEGAGGWRLQAAGDRTAHDHLVARLAELRPDDAVLSEEGADDRSRLAAERTWIIDPLDGTQDFSRVGSAEWAVHVALVVDGRPVAGAVSVPAGGGLYGTAQHPVPGGTARERPIVVTSRSQWGHAEDVAAAIGGEVHAHPSGLYEWDACAPVAVAAAAGLDATGVDGSVLVFNKSRPVVPGLLISRPEYTKPARAALRW